MDQQNSKYQGYEKITPEIVKAYTAPTDKFLCPLNANTHHIQFLNFKIRDVESNEVFFEIQRNPSENFEEEINMQIPPEQEEMIRTVRYNFSEEFFKLDNVGTLLVFSVGAKPVKDFVMIERHYAKEKLIKSFEFKFPFCIPNTTNEWEAIYQMPQVDEETKKQMINEPYTTRSDSFYFVEGKLVMHNKAEYAYNG